jgi:hypothetical protein
MFPVASFSLMLAEGKVSGVSTKWLFSWSASGARFWKWSTSPSRLPENGSCLVPGLVVELERKFSLPLFLFVNFSNH